jgi:hypothetical protein
MTAGWSVHGKLVLRHVPRTVGGFTKEQKKEQSLSFRAVEFHDDRRASGVSAGDDR